MRPISIVYLKIQSRYKVNGEYSQNKAQKRKQKNLISKSEQGTDGYNFNLRIHDQRPSETRGQFRPGYDIYQFNTAI